VTSGIALEFDAVRSYAASALRSVVMSSPESMSETTAKLAPMTRRLAPRS
jgi:hypothetical protein